MIELPKVSRVLDAVESGLSDDNRALLSSNLTRRAFALGVASTLEELYSDRESQQALSNYLLQTLRHTMFSADPFEATRSGQALEALKVSVQEALTTRRSIKVDGCSQALDDVLKKRLQYCVDAVRDSQSILDEISILFHARRSETSDSEFAHRAASLLQTLRETLARMEIGREK